MDKRFYSHPGIGDLFLSVELINQCFSMDKAGFLLIIKPDTINNIILIYIIVGRSVFNDLALISAVSLSPLAFLIWIRKKLDRVGLT